MLLAASSAKAQHIETAYPEIGPLENICPHHVHADREFGGNGPNVIMSAGLNASPDDRFARSSYDFWARETKKNWTRAVRAETEEIYQPGDCFLIDTFGSDTYTDWTEVDHDHDLNYSPVSGTEFVRSMKFRGDTSNNDVGNCTPDDTKFWYYFNDITVVSSARAPECAKPNGDPPDVTEVDGSAVLSAINAIAAQMELYLDNVGFSLGYPLFVANNSHLEFDAPPLIRIPFTIPVFHSGPFTFYIDDVASDSITVEPDGGGYMFKFSFETNGVEIRSSCEPKYQNTGGDYIDPIEVFDAFVDDHMGIYGVPYDSAECPQDPVVPTCTKFLDYLQSTEVSLKFDSFLDEVACDFVGDITVDLDTIEAQIRLFFEVDGSMVRFRRPSAARPEMDLWVNLGVASQTGPCENHVLGAFDFCMENDELEAELEANLRLALADIVFQALDPAAQPTNVFGAIMSQLLTAFTGMPANLVAIVIRDSPEGEILFVTN